MAVLELFAKQRAQQIAEAQREKRDWPPQWLSDLHAACAVLARHPLGTDAQIAWHYDVLVWLGGRQRAAQVIEEGLARFPDSAALHERLRARVLEERGHEGLEPAYEALLAQRGATPALQWYAACASVAVAEFERRAGAADPALAAYERALARFERCAADPDLRESAHTQIALALAGRARIAFERDDLERAVAELLASFGSRPEAAATEDGLNTSPMGTARMLLRRLQEKERADLAAEIEAALQRLEQLDPALLALPAYERDVQGRSFRPGGP
jgi:hypothetical protein